MKEVTPEEAIDLLETKYHMEGQIDNVLECLTIRKAAIEALKKQIPMGIANSRMLTELGYPFSMQGDCPSCGCRSLRSINTDYCICCGQRLDWKN